MRMGYSLIVKRNQTTNQTTTMKHSLDFRLVNTFNDHTISHHRTLRNAVLASDRYSRSVRHANGSNSYMPTRIDELCDGEWLKVDIRDLHNTEHSVGII